MVSLSRRLHFIILCTDPFFPVAGHYITTPLYKPCVYVHFSNWLAPETYWIELKYFHFHFWVVVFLLISTASFGGGELAGILEMKRYCASGKLQQWKWMRCKDITIQTATPGHYIRITSNRRVNERARKRETLTGKKTTCRRCRLKCRKNAEDSCTVYDLIKILCSLLQAFKWVFYVRYMCRWKIISIKYPVLKSDLFYR